MGPDRVFKYLTRFTFERLIWNIVTFFIKNSLFQKSLISKYLKVKVAVGDSSNIYLFRLIKILKPQTIFEKSIFGFQKNQKLITRD